MWNCNICQDGEYFIVLDRIKDYEYGIDCSNFSIVKCKKCSFISLNPTPTKKELLTFYPKNYHNYTETKSFLMKYLNKLYRNKQIKAIKPFIKINAKVLELGPGRCELLIYLKEKYNCDVSGVEISNEMCRFANKKGIKVFHGILEDVYKKLEKNSYDMIYMSHILEHVINPRKTISICKKLLKEEGCIVCETPNIDAIEFKVFKRYFGLIHAPRHISFFTPKTLRLLFEKEGFKIEKFSSEIVTFSWALSVQNFMGDKLFRLSKKPREFYYPLLLVIFLPITFFQSIFTKPGIISFAAIKKIN